jgi:hypothetical protein
MIRWEITYRGTFKGYILAPTRGYAMADAKRRWGLGHYTAREVRTN